MTPSVKKSLKKLGYDLRIARKKRRLRLVDLAAAASCSPDTLRRLEAGDPGVSIGVLAMVLLGLDRRSLLGDLLDVSRDAGGLLLEETRLPQRVRKPRQAIASDETRPVKA